MKWYYKIIIVLAWIASAYIMGDKYWLYTLSGVVLIHIITSIDARKRAFDRFTKVFEEFWENHKREDRAD
jgi:hypothetical protein